jgi:hypothetical protein
MQINLTDDDHRLLIYALGLAAGLIHEKSPSLFDKITDLANQVVAKDPWPPALKTGVKE